MASFSSIAPYYNRIFPYKKGRADFIESLLDEKPSAIIDLGCATGSLVIDLASRGHRVVGLDLNEEMIGIAKKSVTEMKAGADQKPEFLVLDMLKIDEAFPAESIDLVSCLGNTVVQLQSPLEIKELFARVKKILKPAGRFVFQIVNYDRIMKDRAGQLPFIDNDEVAFSRQYIFQEGSPLVEFKTRIVDKKTGAEVNNSSMLYPALSGELKKWLNETGFNRYVFYGDFTKIPFENDSPALVAVAGS